MLDRISDVKIHFALSGVVVIGAILSFKLNTENEPNASFRCRSKSDLSTRKYSSFPGASSNPSKRTSTESGRVNDDLFPRMASSSSLLKRALTTNTLNSPSERKMVVKMRKKKKSALNRDVGEKRAVLRTRVSFRLVRCVANASELARAAVSCAIRFKVVERVSMKNKLKYIKLQHIGN